MEIPIILLTVCLIACAICIYILYTRVNKLTELIGNAALAISDVQNDRAEYAGKIDELNKKFDAASELIDAAKELTDEQIKTEKKFREGLEAIVNY